MNNIQSPYHLLTRRQHQVLDGHAKGLMQREIATELGISQPAVSKHLYNAKQKLARIQGGLTRKSAAEPQVIRDTLDFMPTAEQSEPTPSLDIDQSETAVPVPTAAARTVSLHAEPQVSHTQQAASPIRSEFVAKRTNICGWCDEPFIPHQLRQQCCCNSHGRRYQGETVLPHFDHTPDCSRIRPSSPLPRAYNGPKAYI